MTIHFHSPFRIGTGSAREGLGATVDREDLIPATSLKGVMRASAGRLLPARPDVLEAVFGAPRLPSPWHWGPVQFPAQRQTAGDQRDPEPVIVTRARVQLDARTGTAKRAHLVVGEEVTVPGGQARFAVERIDALRRGMSERQHLAVLACAAAGVHELGAGRGRGLGWVSCTTADPSVDDEVLATLEELLAEKPIPAPSAGREGTY